jgi:hypothetical protein
MLLLTVALLAGATACGSSSSSSSSHQPAVDDDGSPDDDDNDDASPDDDDDNDSAVSGACCDRYDACYNATGADCSNIYDGSWHTGDCASYNCGTETGACCLPGGNCNDMITQSSCTAAAGVWTGDNACQYVTCPSWSVQTDTAAVLFSVWGSSASDVWAVGGTQSSGDPTAGYWYHNDGSGSWTSTKTLDAEMLYGVWGSSFSDVYAVGAQYTSGAATAGVLWHYNGSAWSDEGPTTDADLLYGVWGSSASDVFVVGWDTTTSASVILHGNGAGWSPMTNASGFEPELYSVWGTAATDVYAAGYGGDIGYLLHYDGTSWTKATKTIAGYTAQMYGVWGSSASDLFIVGYWSSIPEPLIIHGLSDIFVSIPAGTSDNVALESVWGTSVSNIYAVGNDYTTSAGEILHCNGTAWSPLTLPSGTNGLYGVWGSSAADVYAVGYSNSSASPGVILHYGS